MFHIITWNIFLNYYQGHIFNLELQKIFTKSTNDLSNLNSFKNEKYIEVTYSNPI